MLGLALKHLHRESGVSRREVADAAGVSVSFVTRVMLGQRVPSWQVVCAMAEVLGGEPAELRMLWETARDIARHRRWPRQPARDRLKAALRGLYLAAGQPDLAELCAQQAESPLTADTIQQVLDGAHIPEWNDLRWLVVTLGGRPEDVRPYWDEVYSSQLHVLAAQPGLRPRRSSRPPSPRQAEQERDGW